MGPGLKFLLLAMMLTNLSMNVEAEGLLSLITNPMCLVTTGLSNFPECTNDLHNSVKPFISKDGKVPEVVYCCAVTTFRYCIMDKIGKECGSNAEDLINGLINTAVTSFKSKDLTCDGNEIYYRKESPICWAVWGHALGAVALGILLLVSCCCCCKFCCGKSKKTNPAPVVVTLFSNPEGRSASNTYSTSSVPYKQLTDASAA